MTAPGELRVSLFADGADRARMLELCAQPHIRGLTTNPTLMRKAGVTDYRAFARDILREITSKPVCFEVLADDFGQMQRQAEEIAGWADNVYVKIPVTNTQRRSSAGLVRTLTAGGVKVNVTAVTTLAQVREMREALDPRVPAFVSVFAGRIADTGVDPVPVVAQAVELLRAIPRAGVIWASSRELLNIFQAESVGCHAITLTHDILGRLGLIGRDLSEYSLDTVKMFHDDARRAGFSL